VVIEHPSENSMASVDFTIAVLDKGTTFFFGSWNYITNGSGGFNNCLANSRESETPAAAQRSDLDEMLPDLAREIEEESAINVT
jgi:hypothetical protein